MAKQHGPAASYFSGRQGEVVGAKLKGGEYVSRTYQPNVKNPNTERQRNSRQRMTISSRIAAALAAAIQIGYAKATASTRMYPRNMFVRDLVRTDGMGALVITDGEAMVDKTKLKLSARSGITTTLTTGVATMGENHVLTIPVTVGPVSDVLPEGYMGLIVVVYDESDNTSVVSQHRAPVNEKGDIEMTLPSTMDGKEVQIFSFLKWVPASKNDISTDTLPWKFPSETGETVYGGAVTVG